MTDPQSAIVFATLGSVTIIRFNQPSKRNPLSKAVLHELGDVVRATSERDDTRSIVFTGTDDVFASGADIRELATLNSESAHEFSKFGQELFQKIADARQVTIAAINGYCMGGALDLALACDLRVASANAIFAHPGARLGIITGWGGTQRLPRMIGKVRALEFFATARRVSSQEALEIGLITQIHDPVLESALALAITVPIRVGGDTACYPI